MVIRKIVLVVMVSLVMILAGTCWADGNPFQGMTQDPVVQKFFAGRQLDPIEGVWLNDNLKPIIIIKSSFIGTSNNGNYDYLMVEYSSSSNVEIDGVYKTQYPSCFERGKNLKNLLRFVSPTTLQVYDAGSYGHPLYSFYTCIYPNSAVVDK